MPASNLESAIQREATLKQGLKGLEGDKLKEARKSLKRLQRKRRLLAIQAAKAKPKAKVGDAAAAEA